MVNSVLKALRGIMPHIRYLEKFKLTQLLVGTLGVIFFAIFFREPPRIVKV